MKFTFFTLCGISEQKGLDKLLYAIQALENHLKNKVNFVIGGGGGELENYKKLALSLSLNNVKWLGPVRREEAPALFQSSHAFIMLSRHETFGIVYAEALATGIPVIATECGGPEDIINDINGVLIKMDSPEQAAKAIKEVFTHYSHYDSKVIRADFENRFSKIKFIDKMKKIYQEAVACAE
jgi:glycosyltransferase involved in cell wall biosynthesis